MFAPSTMRCCDWPTPERVATKLQLQVFIRVARTNPRKSGSGSFGRSGPRSIESPLARLRLRCSHDRMNPHFGKLVGTGIVILVLIIAASQATFVVEPGFRGVEVTLGKVSEQFKPEGF